ARTVAVTFWAGSALVTATNTANPTSTTDTTSEMRLFIAPPFRGFSRRIRRRALCVYSRFVVSCEGDDATRSARLRGGSLLPRGGARGRGTGAVHAPPARPARVACALRARDVLRVRARDELITVYVPCSKEEPEWRGV